MKTYTIEEYDKRYGRDGELYWSKGQSQKWSKSYLEGIRPCSCIRLFVWRDGNWGCWDECENCLGYGIPPIPWSELNK